MKKNSEIVFRNEWYKIFKDSVVDKRENSFPEYYVIHFEQESVASVIINKKKKFCLLKQLDILRMRSV